MQSHQVLGELHVVVEPLLTEVARERLVLLGRVRVDDVDLQVLLELEALAAVLAQVIVERGVNITVMFLLLKEKKFTLQDEKSIYAQVYKQSQVFLSKAVPLGLGVAHSAADHGSTRDIPNDFIISRKLFNANVAEIST